MTPLNCGIPGRRPRSSTRGSLSGSRSGPPIHHRPRGVVSGVHRSVRSRLKGGIIRSRGLCGNMPLSGKGLPRRACSFSIHSIAWKSAKPSTSFSCSRKLADRLPARRREKPRACAARTAPHRADAEARLRRLLRVSGGYVGSRRRSTSKSIGFGAAPRHQWIRHGLVRPEGCPSGFAPDRGRIDEATSSQRELSRR